MNPINLISARYLFSRKNISLVSTLTLISIGGVTLGTALLIAVLSVFNGFFDLIKNLLLTYDPDIRIESSENRTFVLADSVLHILADIPEISIVSPYLQGKSLLAYRGNRDKVVEVRGIEPQTFFQIIKAQGLPESQSLEVQNRMPGLFMGDQLGGSLGLNNGDRVSLLSATGIQRSITSFSGPRYYTFEIRGMFYLRTIFEGSLVFVDIEAARRIFNSPNQVSGVEIRLLDHENAASVKSILVDKLGPSYLIQTWYDLQKPQYDVMNLEKWGAYFILMLIVLVAVLNIVGSLTMIVIQKSKDIGILLAMGYNPSLIRRIFLRQGVYIGIIGCGLGGLLGVFFCWMQIKYEIIKLVGSESFIIDAYPVIISPFDVILVLAGSLFLCLLASWYPAMRAASVQPADVLRYE